MDFGEVFGFENFGFVVSKAKVNESCFRIYFMTNFIILPPKTPTVAMQFECLI